MYTFPPNSWVEMSSICGVSRIRFLPQEREYEVEFKSGVSHLMNESNLLDLLNKSSILSKQLNEVTSSLQLASKKVGNSKLGSNVKNNIELDNALPSTVRTILIVEDDAPTLEMLVELISGWAVQAQIVTARDGLEGLEKFQQSQPSILVTNIYMPRMSGCDFLLELRRIGKCIPTLIYSGSATEQLLKESGIQLSHTLLLLNKPTSPENLLSTLIQLSQEV
jgi:CheY-like chemotaxis protein